MEPPPLLFGLFRHRLRAKTLVRVMLVIVPGRPIAQGRGRAVRIGAGVRVIDPERSRSWKATAQEHMRIARGRRPMLEGPIKVEILAVFACPKADHRKVPVDRRWCDRAYGDADNIAKAVLDAGNSVLWLDDRQVASLSVERLIGFQGEPERVEIAAFPCPASTTLDVIFLPVRRGAEDGSGRAIGGRKASRYPDGPQVAP